MGFQMLKIAPASGSTSVWEIVYATGGNVPFWGHKVYAPKMIRPHHIDEAYQWLCKQRGHHPDNADIWQPFSWLNWIRR